MPVSGSNSRHLYAGMLAMEFAIGAEQQSKIRQTEQVEHYEAVS